MPFEHSPPAHNCPCSSKYAKKSFCHNATPSLPAVLTSFGGYHSFLTRKYQIRRMIRLRPQAVQAVQITNWQHSCCLPLLVFEHTVAEYTCILFLFAKRSAHNRLWLQLGCSAGSWCSGLECMGYQSVFVGLSFSSQETVCMYRCTYASRISSILRCIYVAPLVEQKQHVHPFATYLRIHNHKKPLYIPQKWRLFGLLLLGLCITVTLWHIYVASLIQIKLKLNFLELKGCWLVQQNRRMYECKMVWKMFFS